MLPITFHPYVLSINHYRFCRLYYTTVQYLFARHLLFIPAEFTTAQSTMFSSSYLFIRVHLGHFTHVRPFFNVLLVYYLPSSINSISSIHQSRIFLLLWYPLYLPVLSVHNICIYLKYISIYGIQLTTVPVNLQYQSSRVDSTVDHRHWVHSNQQKSFTDSALTLFNVLRVMR
jgi:hypothetical protein